MPRRETEGARVWLPEETLPALLLLPFTLPQTGLKNMTRPERRVSCW